MAQAQPNSRNSPLKLFAELKILVEEVEEDLSDTEEQRNLNKMLSRPSRRSSVAAKAVTKNVQNKSKKR